MSASALPQAARKLGCLQVVKEPEDLEALAKELTVRHTRVGRQRMQRLDTVYRC